MDNKNNKQESKNLMARVMGKTLKETLAKKLVIETTNDFSQKHQSDRHYQQFLKKFAEL